MRIRCRAKIRNKTSNPRSFQRFFQFFLSLRRFLCFGARVWPFGLQPTVGIFSYLNRDGLRMVFRFAQFHGSRWNGVRTTLKRNQGVLIPDNGVGYPILDGHTGRLTGCNHRKPGGLPIRCYKLPALTIFIVNGQFKRRTCQCFLHHRFCIKIWAILCIQGTKAQHEATKNERSRKTEWLQCYGEQRYLGAFGFVFRLF